MDILIKVIVRAIFSILFSQTIEHHLFSSRRSACPTQRFPPQFTTLTRSEQCKSKGIFFARENITTQGCIHTSNRQGCRAPLSKFDAHFDSGAFSFLYEVRTAPTCCPHVCLRARHNVSRLKLAQRSAQLTASLSPGNVSQHRHALLFTIIRRGCCVSGFE